MELDAIAAIWRKYDARLDELVRSEALLQRRSSLVATQTVLDRLRRTLWFEIIIDSIVVWLLGSFSADHARELPVFLAGVVLDGYATAILAATVAQLVASFMDFDEPLIALARKAERLRLLRATTAMWTLLLAPLMWPALAIAGVRALLDVEPMSAFGLPWLLANVVFGVAVLAAALRLARRHGSGAQPDSWFRRFSDSISGKHVRAATDQLSALLQYEGNETSA
jgi:hypothetical protein